MLLRYCFIVKLSLFLHLTRGLTPIINLNILTNANGFKIDGIAPGDWSGKYVSGGGDINNDGYADILIGAIYANS